LELLDAMRVVSADHDADAKEIFKRIAFNCLINNVDDHLQNVGFLHVGQGKWRLAPAFDINPFPDKSPESKSWLSPDTGLITEIGQLIEHATFFGLDDQALRDVLLDLVSVISKWAVTAQSTPVGMTAKESSAFKQAFEGPAIAHARAWLG
jgi:serine/threonine-protein kinase HipA